VIGFNRARLRLRYQVLATLIAAVPLPIIFQELVRGVDPTTSEQITINISLMLAIVGGILVYRRFDDFPGARSIGSIIPSFIASYSCLILVFFFIRLDYSGWQFVWSFVLSVLGFAWIQIYIGRNYSMTFAVVPGGRVSEQIADVSQANWVMLQQPEVPTETINGVVADLRHDHSPHWERMMADCALAGVPVFHLKDAVERLTGRVDIEHLSENSLGSLNPDRTYIKFKAVIDWIVAAITLVVASPILVGIAVLIRLESPGPALFRQRRMGFRGTPFYVIKFRTMRHGAVATDLNGDTDDALRVASMTLQDDPRITRLGGFLRRTRLDELPQILNILKNDMSWIGPRPEALPLTRWYEGQLPFYHYRHILKPGITGWAQVSQGHVAGIDEVREKLRYDFYYVKNFSPWLDTLIILKTIAIIFTGFGAR